MKHEERSEQSPQQWLSRHARERRDLSALVEAALVDDTAQDMGLEEDQEEQVEAGRDGVLIPPRLSLQSRVMPAVGGGRIVEGTTTHHMVVRPDSEERRTAPATQPGGRLTRLAQRITSSFAAFGFAMRPEALMHQTELPDAGVENADRAGGHEGRERSTPTPVSGDQAEGAGKLAEKSFTPERAMQLPQSKQRLAGHTGKIRLETAELEAIKSAARPESTDPAPGHFVNVDLNVAPSALPEHGKQRNEGLVRNIENEESIHRALLQSSLLSNELLDPTQAPAFPSASPASYAHVRDTSAHMPALDVTRREAGGVQEVEQQIGQQTSFGRERSSGRGLFEAGQGDVVVSDMHVAAESVVLVTLIGNPGPVVVQYISLLPQEGFTVHLTAPAASRTPFNYVVL